VPFWEKTQPSSWESTFMPLELLNISADRLSQLPKEKTVFFFPVSALEDHGPHLPLGLKLFEARKLCELAATRLERELPDWTGVIMPDAPLGVDTVTTATALPVRAHVLRDWLLDCSRGLMRHGFVHFACFSGHLCPRQLTAIEEAGKMLLRGRAWLPSSLSKRAKRARRGHTRATLVSACSALVSAREVRRSPLWADPPEHGGAGDTGIGLYLSPAAVASSFVELSAKQQTGSYWRRGLLRSRRKLGGYWGIPADAEASEGQKHLENKMNDIFPKLRATWEGSNPNHLFRSWYSVIPPNKGFFKIWVLAFVLIAILWIWTFFAIEGLITTV